jgi:ABC-type sugar transport systems, permease components
MAGGKDSYKFYLFILPWLIGFCVFFLTPLATTVFYAFTDIRLPNVTQYQFVGFQNFTNLIGDQIFLKSIRNTLYFVFVGVPVNVISVLLIALILNFDVKGIRWFRTLYYLPTLVPIVATAIIWQLIFNYEFGIVNGLLSGLGIGKVNWLGGEATIKPVIILMTVWISGSGVLIFLAALKGVPKHLYEAAKIDGAGPFTSFVHITLPMISPSMLFVVLIQTIYNFQMFSEAFLLARGGPNFASTTYVYNIYRSGFIDIKFSVAMAQSIVLFVFILLTTVLLLKFSQKHVYYEGETRG